MAEQQSAAPAPQMFAHKGAAQPASGLRSVTPEVAGADAPPASAAAASPRQSSPPRSDDNELAEAASLGVSGFTTAGREMAAPPAPAVAAQEPGAAVADRPHPNAALAGPAGIDSALAEAVSAPRRLSPLQQAVFAGRGNVSNISRPIIVGAAFAALLAVSLGIGYGISTIAHGAASGDGADVPTAAAAAQSATSVPGR